MEIGDEVYEEGRSYVLFTLVDTLGDSALVERKDGTRFWIPQRKLRRW